MTVDGPRAAGFAPDQAMSWLRALLPKRLQPALRGLRKRSRRLFLSLEKPYFDVYPYTQAHPLRQRNLVRLAEMVVREGIAGEIVECGVLDGGTAALMAWATRDANPPRQIHLFDAWLGLPEAREEDGTASAKWSGQVVGSPRRVGAVMRKLGIADESIHIHRGWFDDTFPHVHVQAALVHVDCDFFEPTRLCLEKWYPLLAPGGFMQFDDYDAFSGCRKAVDEFLSQHFDVRLETLPGVADVHFFRKPRGAPNQ
jgi:O-methyltransferase